MKKNFISILILAFTIINLALSAITMYSVVNTNQKTADIVTAVANVMNLELGTAEDATKQEIVPIENTEIYEIPDQMTVGLKSDADGKAHYCMVTVFFSINKKHKDYKEYGATVSTNSQIFKSIIGEVFQQYTVEDARANQDEIRAEILKRVQAKYQDSDFIYDVSFSEIMFQ